MANWIKLEVVFRLKSPLHIGYMPFKGSVISPTRYYVPGKNFWGAVTKRITEYLCKNPSEDNYRKIGSIVMENFKFLYFYVFDGEHVYMPHYTNEGLKFGNENQHDFEQKFISSRLSTAVDASSGTASDGSLHEIEFINNKFKDKSGRLKDTKIKGYIWIRENAEIENYKVEIKNEENSLGIFINNFNVIEELILGGESKYGFGHVLLESIKESENIENTITIKMEKDKPLTAPLKYCEDIKFKGDIELITGRGYFDPKDNNSDGSNEPGDRISKLEYYFSPGTVLLLDNSIDCEVAWDGTLLICQNDKNN
ncbi:hypothetical protein [Thermoanaerobacterium sp. RBIITD]|uniref:hypothetical protein n=1 Tax=Thermoanaerobacterium sp. RBIITD TaxID=1550240 RepID=UPI000BB6B56A|nr:hypothetical protein [Thermoanaerobacterium sp. RBIITD]SNX54961.1 hypothetical protein SAMN05660242_2717 [Thermoanaerobacterium sp. RBIITD]